MTGSMRNSIQCQKRPLIHIWSGGTSTNRSTSTSGSLRYSRGSSNTTLKSTTRTHSENNSIRFVSDSRKHSPDLSPIEQSIHSPSGSAGIHANIPFPATTLYHTREDPIMYRSAARSRREIFNYTLSIPTTINEESSRCSKTPSPHPERATFRSICDEFEGENNDIEWVESKILESRLNRYKLETQMRNKEIEKRLGSGTSDGISARTSDRTSGANSTKQVTFQTSQLQKDVSTFGAKSEVTIPTKTDCSVEVKEACHVTGHKEGSCTCADDKEKMSQRVPLIVTDLVSDSLNDMKGCRQSSRGALLQQKEESRDSGAESDIEASASETDMLLSSDNLETDPKNVGTKLISEMLDNETDSSNV